MLRVVGVEDGELTLGNLAAELAGLQVVSGCAAGGAAREAKCAVAQRQFALQTDSFLSCGDRPGGIVAPLELSGDGIQGVADEGVSEIQTVGTMIDHNLHEAVEEVKSAKPPGTITEEVSKGYILNGRVIRPAKVKVAK